MALTVDKIFKTTKQLLPTGRAFRAVVGSDVEKLFKGLYASLVRVDEFALSTLDRILPDNDNFTSEDAALWEQRLGLRVNPDNVTLDERKAIILRKYQHPGTIAERQSAEYIEDQLQAAGFNVFVHENRFLSVDIGDSLFGGKVAYINNSGNTDSFGIEDGGGFVVSESILSSTRFDTIPVLYGTKDELNDGATNTSLILASSSTSQPANFCDNLVVGDFSDFYLPSVNELKEIQKNYSLLGLSSGFFWSSTESDNGLPTNFERAIRMSDGFEINANKNSGSVLYNTVAIGKFTKKDTLNGPYEYVDYIGGNIVQLSDDIQLSDDVEMGGTLPVDFVVNSAFAPEAFDIGATSNQKGVFFVGGENFPDTVEVSPDREFELRQLILALKPVNTVCILLVEYTTYWILRNNIWEDGGIWDDTETWND